MEDIVLKLAVIGAAGIAAQWFAWRLQLPAIVLLLAAGFIAGPATGFLDPATDFGDIYRPMVSIAVAIILFEGGLTLNFSEIRETSKAVRRIIMYAGPMVWGMGALAAHYIGGLSWPTAIVLGAILVVTGPTVIMPLLRQAQLDARPASLLRWEAIVNDPIGALFAVVAFEIILVYVGLHAADNLPLLFLSGFGLAIGAGWASAKFIVWTFVRGHVPEYLKAPVLLSSVVAVYALTNMVLEESGLLTVTIMGVVLANSRIASLTDMRRFKETITTLLVSGVFIILTASLSMDDIRSLDLGAALFVAVLLLVIRPVAIMLATIKSGATIQERILTSWIAPRGVVAVAVSGLFGTLLADAGVEDAGRMVAFTFAVVVTTIVLHGFTLKPLAAFLNLKKASKPGILLVGGSRWSTALAAKLKEADVPVMLADQNWNHLAEARLGSIPVYFGEVLSESAHHAIDPKRFSSLIATSDNDAYNALVCTDFGPELGRNHVFQIGRIDEKARQSLNFTLGGRPLTKEPVSFLDLREKLLAGWTFQLTRLTDEFGWKAYADSRPAGAIILLWIKPSGALVFAATAAGTPGANDRILGFALPKDDARAEAASQTARKAEATAAIKTAEGNDSVTIDETKGKTK
ncbi:NhaP-type Na+/H+ and K+/H+ antiporter [Hoeflea phototrophica DFL-43]|jgi:NhaP-type Na+/H+ or K+/H+ antiporter|uniref:NhaP-type Na+/H+ and K+/H+ antiporter n=1 Tax=Hoeflea phototrophica (strain DSM 17068 / NCIMB 14078 / DFL-43) TaxID=411684 RepID=A9DC89_HOEPD|nr:sodium:proton antiporter [Hoeflea phototrophica]EDQ32378.1 NhaP-type Na+/H+ and K+/H+ antiporter [Hoeflea phototrophica DFL-43]